MSEPARKPFAQVSLQAGAMRRFRENLASLWTIPRVAMPAGPSQLHLLDEPRARTSSRAQFGSAALHVSVAAAVVYALTHPILPTSPPKNLQNPSLAGEHRIAYFLAPATEPSEGKRGSGGRNNPLPATAGNLLPMSNQALMSPRLPDSRPHPLSVQLAVREADAPEIVPPVQDPGLPWNTDRNLSEGKGKDGIGKGPDGSMGDSPGFNGSGIGADPRSFAAAASPVVCKYCPDPLYSEDARRQKLQGTVTMRVLVGADGRARDIRVTHGLGLGLDENSVQAVRSWLFIPARDASHRPVASWITIETLFRLY